MACALRTGSPCLPHWRTEGRTGQGGGIPGERNQVTTQDVAIICQKPWVSTPDAQSTWEQLGEPSTDERDLGSQGKPLANRYACRPVYVQRAAPLLVCLWFSTCL